MRDAPDSNANGTAQESDGAVVLRSLTDEELLELLNKLMFYAAKRYFGRLSAKDLAMQAVADTLAGQRTLNTAYTVFKNLCLILKSIASNQLEKEKRFLPILPDELGVDAGSSQSSPLLPSYPSPQEIYETSETQRDLGRQLHEAAGDDGLSRSVVEVSLEREAWKPKEMAATLNVKEKDIYNVRLRLRRRLRRRLNKSQGR